MNFKILNNKEDNNFILIIRHGTTRVNKGIYLTFDEMCSIDKIVEKSLSQVPNSGIILRDNFVFPDYDKFRIRQDDLYENDFLVLFYSSETENTGYALSIYELCALQCLLKEYILMGKDS